MANPVTVTDLEKALDALIARDVPPPLTDDDIIIVKVKKKARCNHDQAKELIDRWVASGEVEYIGKRRSGSRVVDAWRIVGK